MYTKESIASLKNRIDIVEILSDYLLLKRIGNTYKGLCPFHLEKTPSFIVNKLSGFYHCFGCGAHGDSIAFLMNYLGYSFSETIEFLCKKFNVQLDTIKLKEEDKENKNYLKEASEQVSLLFKYCLFRLTEGKEVLNYLYKRGISFFSILRFSIGYAPSKKIFFSLIKELKLPYEVLKKIGIISNDGTRFLFEERIIFPIHNVLGQVIGFSARKWKDQTYGGKYINSPETLLFKKATVFFGLHYCRRRIMKEKTVILVEGQIDCLQLIEAGLDLTLASLGTALGEGHVRELERLGIRKVYLFFDGDQAGKIAAIKTGNLLQGEGIEVKICSLSSKLDPDIFIFQYGIKSVLDLLDKSEDYLSFLIEETFKKYDINSPIQKTEAVELLISQISQWKNSIVIHESLKKLASIMQLPEEMIGLGKIKTATLKYSSEKINNLKSIKKGSLKNLPIDPNFILETDVLRWLIFLGDEYPEFVLIAKKYLQSNYFYSSDCKILFEACLLRLETKEPLDLLSLSQIVDNEKIIDWLIRKKINKGNPKTDFIQSIQKMVDREWNMKKEKINVELKTGKSQNLEELLIEYDQINRERISVEF